MAEEKKGKVDLSKIDLEDLKDKSAEHPGLISFPHTVGGAVVKPEDEGRMKGKAMSAMKEQTSHQLHQLYDQMKMLVEQANAIKKRVEVSEKIYMSQMNFDPLIGQTYYLYEKEDGSSVLSMISPEEWGEDLPYKLFSAKVRLLSDHTWEVLS